MNHSDLFTAIGGEFFTQPDAISKQWRDIRAVIFDWDGVFNSGHKTAEQGSGFSEPDAMAVNLLRFSHYLQQQGNMMITVIITGEINAAAFQFAKREKFNAVYYSMSHKVEALEHLSRAYSIHPSQVLFFFDDVLDLSVARLAGLRLNIGRKASPAFKQYLKEKNLVDYITAHNGGEYGIREGVEMILSNEGIFTEAVNRRVDFDQTYQDYLLQRRAQQTYAYTKNASSGLVGQVSYPFEG